jgi:hypothetical protein
VVGGYAQGWSVKDEVAWNGPELTDTARNRYRDLVGIVANFSLLAHSTFTISVDVIAGESQVLPRCSLLPPFGRWRGRWLGDEHAGASPWNSVRHLPRSAGGGLQSFGALYGYCIERD